VEDEGIKGVHHYEELVQKRKQKVCGCAVVDVRESETMLGSTMD
jgi:hypothetical protein